MRLSDKKLWLRQVLPLVTGLGILIYIIAKATIVQVTHDEVYTIHILSPQPTWDLISYKDSYTNNHILNTLLIKALFSIFGEDHVLGRVPNIAAFIMYFIYTYRFSKRYIKEDWVSFMFVVVMISNPYLLDFFALARGYGLAIGFMMGSIYYAARYIIDDEMNALPLSILMAILSVYAQFALLHYYLGVSLLFLIVGFKKYFESKNRIKLWQSIGIQFGGLVLLALLIYLPIMAIVKDNQIAYYGTRGFWQDTISSIIYHSVYAQGYFSEKTLDIFKNLTIILLVLSTLYTIWSWVKKSTAYPSVFVVSTFGCVVLSVLLQFYLIGNQFVTDRTALFFYPFLAMLMPMLAAWSFEVSKKMGITVALIFILFSVNHVRRSGSLKSYREWWYDTHTYEILDFLKSEYDKSDKKQPLKFHLTWLFHPSFIYYQEHRHLDWLQPVKYDKEPDSTNYYDFYYCTRDELPAIEKLYEKIKEWDDGQWILLKRRVTPQ